MAVRPIALGPREEVAQLSGVGVTWYTWLEQGRPINASVQVLDAIGRTLKLDATERAHLFRLADVPGAAGIAACDDCPLPDEIQQILDALAAGIGTHQTVQCQRLGEDLADGHPRIEGSVRVLEDDLHVLP